MIRAEDVGGDELIDDVGSARITNAQFALQQAGRSTSCLAHYPHGIIKEWIAAIDGFHLGHLFKERRLIKVGVGGQA